MTGSVTSFRGRMLVALSLKLVGCVVVALKIDVLV